MGQFRDAYDGKVVAEWGSGKEPAKWEGRFGLLAGTTMALEGKWAFLAELGERFLRVDMAVDSYAVTEAALERSGQEAAMRKALGEAGAHFMDASKELAQQETKRAPTEFIAQVRHLATVTAALRTPVPRDNMHRIKYMPKPEVGTRLAKQLLRLGEASALVHHRVPVNDDYDLLLRVALDGIPSRRRIVIQAIAKGMMDANGIACATGLPKTTIQETLEDLELLRLVTDQGFTDQAGSHLDRSGLTHLLTR